LNKKTAFFFPKRLDDHGTWVVQDRLSSLTHFTTGSTSPATDDVPGE
jgi:hypothetical protein